MKRWTRARTGLLTIGLLLIVSLAAGPAVSQQQAFVTPGPNVNVIGVTPQPGILRIPDLFRKQQNEPSCVQATDNPADVFCGFNDCRASDWAEVQGDCWIGVAQSSDFGETWTSRLAPGYLGHPYSLGMGFAADPSVAEIPGNSPGLMLLTYIASFRESDQGVIAVQRYVQSPREDGERYLPEDRPPTIIATGSEGRFHDKVASLFIANEDDPQSTTTELVDAEGIAEAVAVERVNGIHIVAYSVFTGNGDSVKILAQRSLDGGKTYAKAKKISEELNTVTGVHLSHVPGKGVSLTYRRRQDSNDSDAVVQSFSSNFGQTWSKTQPIFEICPHDQQASGNSARMFSFPWGANDGERYWVFVADKVDPATGEHIAAQGNCTEVAGAPPGTFPGVPRIVGMSSLDGKNWFGSAENPSEPFILDFNGGIGYQVFPFAQGVKNRVDVAWWDTREEEALRELPDGTELPLIYDYVTSNGARVFRKASIYMTRIRGCSATTPQGACTPSQPTDAGLVSPVRISNYQTALLNGVLQEVEANPLNLRTHSSGRLAFNGDYGAMGTPRFRRLPSGKVIQNSLPQQPGETNFVPNENMFLAWGDNRDVFGDFVANPADPNAQFLYSPPVNATPSLQARRELPAQPEKLLAEKTADGEADLKAAGEPDDELGLPSNADTVACSAAQNFSRSRDSNVYGSLVEDVPSMIALTQARQMNLTQRMFPLVISNPGTAQPGASFCLQIANQPPDYGDGAGSGRASFDPLPARNDPNLFVAPRELLDVLVPPQSSASRAVFVTSSDATTRITVNAYTGSCPIGPSSQLISSVQVGNGQLFDPLFCQQNPANPACLPVAENETHNVVFAEQGGFQAPALQAPSLQAGALLGAPSLQAEGLLAPSFQADGVETPSLQAPSFQAMTFAANNLISPSLQAPSLQAPSLQAALADPGDDQHVFYQDLTRIVTASANVTTTYSADIAVVGLNPDETWVELFVWQPNVHTTTGIDPDTGDCLALPEADNKVIARAELGSPSLQASSLNDVTLPFAFSPENQNPYAGEISFPGRPGDQIAVTVRLWVTGSAKETVDRLFECSTAETPPADCLPQEIENGSFLLTPLGLAAHGCSGTDVNNDDPTVDCISAGSEKITPPDLFPPVFSPQDGGSVSFEAESPDGALVNTPGTVPEGITVTDADPDVQVFCTSPTVVLNDGTTQFPFGDTIVSCTATDTAGNQSNADITISIIDTVAPVITVPADITGVEATGPDGAPVAFVVTATDTTNTAIACSIPDGSGGMTPVTSGDTFPVGTTTVTCTATDQGGNTATDTFDVTVSDTGSPTITVPAPITQEATGPDGATVNFNVTAVDVVDLDVSIECTPDSGSIFALGVTTVTCTATDDAGNTDTASFNVTVEDTTPPQFDPPLADVTVSAGEPAVFTATATDLVDTAVDVQCTIDDGATVVVSGHIFPQGVTEVTCTASDDGRFGDGAGPPNSTTDSFLVTVQLGATGVTTNKKNPRTATSIPLFWAWLDENGVPVDVGTGNQTIEITDCVNPPTIVVNEDPGSSGFQQMPDNSWQYNWQAVDNFGNPLPASNQGGGTPYCITVTLVTTGQQQFGFVPLRP